MVAVLSGGNIDPLLMLRVIEHGLAAAGPLPAADRALLGPAGAAGRCSAQIAEHRANVVDVEHQRAEPAPAASARWRWRCRWRPAVSEHSDTLISALRASGYQVVFAAEA